MEKADVDLFAGRVAGMRQRVSRLFRSAQSGGATQDLLTSAFDELQTALEELQGAVEALRASAQQQLTSFEAVETERRSYADLFEQAPVGYLITSVEGTIRQANRAAADLLGTQPRQLIGRSLALFVPEGSRRSFRARIPQLCQDEGTYEWYTQLQPWEAGPFDALLLVAASHDTAGRPAALRWLVHQLAAQASDGGEPAVRDAYAGERAAQLADRLAELHAQIQALARFADSCVLNEREVGSEQEQGAY